MKPFQRLVVEHWRHDERFYVRALPLSELGILAGQEDDVLDPSQSGQLVLSQPSPVAQQHTAKGGGWIHTVDLREEERVLDVVSEQDTWHAGRECGEQPEEVGAVEQNEV